MTKYDIEPKKNPPDFSYDKGDKQEQDYIKGFLLLLQTFYDKYKHKSPDYVISNVEDYTKKTEKDYLKRNQKLKTFYNDTRTDTLVEHGIVKGKVKQLKNSNPDELDYLIDEQNTTSKSIIGMLGLGLLSKAQRSKYRNLEGAYNIDSNFRTAVNRTQDMSFTGLKEAIQNARQTGLVDLYGDPMMQWITMQDDDVCADCLAIEEDSPLRMSQMPNPPIHPNCRCIKELVNEDDLVLTAAAFALSRY